MAGRIVGIFVMLALSGLLWYVALNRSAREAVIKEVFLLGLRGPFTRQTREDIPTFDGLLMGLGVVFALFFDILALVSLIELIDRGK
jgi:ABC-type Na+ efflux pump permease subunit